MHMTHGLNANKSQQIVDTLFSKEDAKMQTLFLSQLSFKAGKY